MRGFISNKFYISIFGLFFIIASVFIATDKFVTAEEEPAQEAEISDEASEPAEEEIVEEMIEEEVTDSETQESSESSDEITTEEENVEEPEETESSPEQEEAQTATIGDAIENIIDILTPEDKPEEKPEPVVVKEAPKPTSYEATRTYTKKIFVNKEAKHTCEAEVFKVDMSDRSQALNTIKLTKEADISYEIEIGSIPKGFDINFSEGSEYEKQLGSEDESVDISIYKGSSAPEGNFTIPIIYTQKGVFDSSVVCQVNIINL